MVYSTAIENLDKYYYGLPKPYYGRAYPSLQSMINDINQFYSPITFAKEQWQDKTEYIIEKLQKLDEYGILRTIAFLGGAIVGKGIFDPIFDEAFKLGRIDKDMRDNLQWASRWFTGVPLYEVIQSNLYPSQSGIRSTDQDPIFWKWEFWGTKKYLQRS